MARKKTVARVFSSLGLGKPKRDVYKFIKGDAPKDSISFSTVHGRIREIKRDMEKHKFKYKDFAKALDKLDKKEPYSGLKFWTDYVNAGLARIVEKALNDKEITREDVNVFKAHIQEAMNGLERSNQEYKNLQFMFKTDYPYIIGVKNMLSKIIESPEHYANLIYVYAKHGKITPELIEENAGKLISKRKRIRKPRRPKP